MEFGKGKSAWNRFLKSKQGLGLNRPQLQVLYRQQLLLYRSLKDKGSHVGTSTTPKGAKAMWGKRGGLRGSRGGRGSRGVSARSAGKGLRSPGVRGRGGIFKKRGTGCRAADSPWNRFLAANKGLGLNKGQLKLLYRQSSFDTNGAQELGAAGGAAGGAAPRLG